MGGNMQSEILFSKQRRQVRCENNAGAQNEKSVALTWRITIIVLNNTPNASRKICAPLGVTFFSGGAYAFH